MPSRKTKQSTQQTETQEQAAPSTTDTTVDTATRRLQNKFSRGLRRDKATFDLVHSVVAHLAEVTGTEFATLWSNVTTHDDKHFQRHFRKQRRADDPFSGIKKAIPAYSFFTKEHNSKLASQHPDKSFGEISKLVGALWKSLNAKEQARYVKMAEADKKRYQQEVEQRTQELNNAATSTVNSDNQVSAASSETVTEQSTSGKSQRNRGNRKSRK